MVTRSISIELEIAPEVQRAVVDRLKLREAIKQLVDNALEALPEIGGRIGIFAEVNVNNTNLLIGISDNGTGIKKSLLDRVFNEADIPSGERQSRSPMGLKLTKAIIEQHGGELTLNSELNQGTQVQIQLPILTNKSRSLTIKSSEYV